MLSLLLFIPRPKRFFKRANHLIHHLPHRGNIALMLFMMSPLILTRGADDIRDPTDVSAQPLNFPL